ncbi:MAG TPA: Rieske 2Fe-2S domain-containing protein [Terriglobales bacterium]|nr:Rieske 2Fe-2S domain-containing protein [Terriglobales bacterium]
MADENNPAKGVRGRLPAWPRIALNPSVIAAEQAYRKRSNLPLLSEADIEALKAGQPMWWETEGGTPPPAAAVPATPEAAAPVPAAPVAAPPVVAASTTVSAEVQKMVEAGKKWSKSTIAAENARRKRNSLPILNDAEASALLGEPYVSTPAPVATVAATAAPVAAAVARPAAPAATVPQGTSVARGGVSTSYVGTPAVGTSKAARAGGIAATGPDDSPANQQRRRFVWAVVGAFLTAWFLAFFRFFLPRTLFEPATSFKIGYPEEYGLGVDTKWQQKYRIWVDRTPDRLFVIYARCTHLGCTPDWKPSENKFKCPCHGSGYDSEGVNFEGPAPRPMDRAHVELSPDGQILVDVAKLYQWPKGQPSQFNDDGSFLRS